MRTKILVSGISGTVGRAFVRLLKNNHELHGIDFNELGVVKFRRDFPDIKVSLGDFGDFDFKDKGFDMVLHLAAYKHVDIAEENVFATIENNVTKTAKLFKNAKENNVKIVFFSTDKAVEPCSVYGMTKRLGEMMCWELGGQVIRSGNIIGSNGSVLDIWRKAIKNKEPLKITDLEMKRYFIDADVAAHIGWDGISFGRQLVIIDNGGSRKLSDFVNILLADFGWTVDTYPYGIEIIGKRQGERLVEPIRWEYDGRREWPCES